MKTGKGDLLKVRFSTCNSFGITVRMKGHLSSVTAFTKQQPRSPSMPANRSNPLCFTPPKGSACTTATSTSTSANFHSTSIQLLDSRKTEGSYQLMHVKLCMCRVRTKNRAVLGIRALCEAGAKHSTIMRTLMLKVPSSVEAEILLKVRCPPHTPEKFYQFFTIELLQTTGISHLPHVSGHDALLTVEGTC